MYSDFRESNFQEKWFRRLLNRCNLKNSKNRSLRVRRFSTLLSQGGSTSGERSLLPVSVARTSTSSKRWPLETEISRKTIIWWLSTALKQISFQKIATIFMVSRLFFFLEMEYIYLYGLSISRSDILAVLFSLLWNNGIHFIIFIISKIS